MTERKVVPHTRDCASHWDGECDCAPKDREELEAMNLASHRDATRWRQRWEEMRKERDEARAKAREMWPLWSIRQLCEGSIEEWEEAWPWLKEPPGVEGANHGDGTADPGPLGPRP